MSHVVNLKLVVMDLKALEKAAEELGLVMTEKKAYKWWGHSVGDYPLPEGFTAEDLGKCDYALTVKDNPDAYEVGVVKSKKGPGYELMFDFFGGGMGLMEKIGEGAQRLRQRYAINVAKREARKKGQVVKESVGKNGHVILTAVGR